MVKSNGGSSCKCTAYLPWILYGLAVLLTIYLVNEGVPLWRAYLRSVVLFCVGIQGLWSTIGYFMFTERAARCMGWAPSHFQTVLGAASLSLGLIAVASFFITNWLIPVGLIAAIFYAACAIIHIKDRSVRKTKTPCNCSSMYFYMNVVVAVTLLIAIGSY